jgi:phosphatidylglycerol lysyltransferase
MLLDARSFDAEITLGTAIVSTIDVFGVLSEPLKPQNLGGHLFLDSLYIMSLMTYAYVIISLFGPIKQSIEDQSSNREKMLALLDHYSRDSEDFFKIWPADKHYYFYNDAGLAYKVLNGIALVVGNPVGKESDITVLLQLFVDECHINDWTVSFVHIDSTYKDQLINMGFELQKLGEEAVINIEQFNTITVRNKHFRNVNNRFEKQGFTAEIIAPPFSDNFVRTLRRVSDSWLALPGKSERSFMIGYFDPEYINRCSILVVKDDNGQIIAFTNQVPGTKTEANIDLMRHLADSPPNVNDFMFMRFFDEIQKQGFETANLGLCPLVGIDDIDESTTVITNFMKFVYQNGNRFFGFSGLARFKSKFDPEWRNRYIAYQDGIVGFSRAMNALNRAMHIKK